MDIKKLFQQYLDFVKKYIPEPRVHSSVGIDIGLSSCKMVEVKPKGNSFELIQWGIEPIVNGNPSAAVQALLSKTAHPQNAPATAVQGKGTLIRYIDLPRMSLEELKKAFTYEADKYLPFSADQIYLDFMILDPKGKGTKMTVLVAAAKREIINERMELLKNAGIQPDFITLNPIAMGNVINTLSADSLVVGEVKAQGGATAIIDIGAKVTNVNVMYENLPRFTRDIFIGGLDFTRQISNSLGISLDEAEQIKCKAGSRQEDVVKACEPVVLNLISDMRLSFDYFVTEHNIPITKILLSGGASLLDGMTALFANYLEINVARWDPFQYIEVPEALKEESKKMSGQFAVALGLALY